ncbi:unnamed protein product (macronuclear) [Paramecium tetraurelia]|uniref:Uncharacterized protein n=1 Tax=Paramecium tetraurelia TaxID=5888 RepID=A0CM97_PARTE|nr:uncharacterized protein GSPATT00008393001 [Paramecium tetraurelia]CAK71914.1 unnamed protein product [Paramecium tetraurelia]|eukprot:XP_001439311.1 hypothetical protein (macronuclear) [Paramecium tetraurelia strain d4-2]
MSSHLKQSINTLYLFNLIGESFFFNAIIQMYKLLGYETPWTPYKDVYYKGRLDICLDVFTRKSLDLVYILNKYNYKTQSQLLSIINFHQISIYIS